MHILVCYLVNFSNADKSQEEFVNTCDFPFLGMLCLLYFYFSCLYYSAESELIIDSALFLVFSSNILLFFFLVFSQKKYLYEVCIIQNFL